MPTLLEFLRKINIRASIAVDEPMSAHTSFRIGGPADLLVAPETLADLGKLVESARVEGLALTILGGGANILVGDRGIRGIVVETRRLAGIEFEELGEGAVRLRAGAGISFSRLCEAALAQGVGGLENFYAMPGSLGGAVFMNARCYEVEISDRLETATILDAQGRLRNLPLDRRAWSYKHSPFQAGGEEAGSFILGASFVLSSADRHSTGAAMRMRRADREAKGHFRLPSAGSMFKNDRGLGRPTGAILDELGFKGKRIGDAMVSPWHANIFVNAGRASAHDMLALVDLAREEVSRRLGLSIEAEVLFVGEA